MSKLYMYTNMTSKHVSALFHIGNFSKLFSVNMSECCHTNTFDVNEKLPLTQTDIWVIMCRKNSGSIHVKLSSSL